MTSNAKSAKKLTLISLILMIFTSVYGFNNIPRSFYRMGYSAIPWFIVSGITFFIPFAFMMAEFGAAFKNEKGGIYSWMAKSVGPKFAFIGTFMWYASYIIWMVNVASGVWIPISNAIFGKDTTKTWSLFNLSSTKTLGILAVLWIIFVTFVSTKGLEKIKKITSIGGTAVAALNLVLLIGAIAVLIGNHGHLAQTINSTAFTSSPNPGYGRSTISILSFLVYAIFAYGGLEVVGGLVDQTENAEKTFPKGVAIAAIIISIGYSLGIFLIGTFTNWKDMLSDSSTIHIGNVSYVIMANLGYQLGHVFGVSEAVAVSMGAWLARFIGISMFLALTGAFFTLTYAPLKQIIEGTPAEIWPGKLGKIKNDIPSNAMLVQGVIVCVLILLVSFGGASISKFFDILVNMTNVAMTLPYIFIAISFAPFKKKKEIVKPFEVFKTYRSALFCTIIVTFTVGFANFFSIVEPAIDGDLQTTIWSIVGPIFFSIVAWLMYYRYERKTRK